MSCQGHRSSEGAECTFEVELCSDKLISLNPVMPKYYGVLGSEETIGLITRKQIVIFLKQE